MGRPSVLVNIPVPVAVILTSVISLLVPSLAEVTCTIPSVERGETTTLTCHFNMNMQENRKDIVVTRQTNASVERADILDCYWKDSNYKCTTELPHFHFNGIITENLTLELPKAGEEDRGNYSCVILPENTPAKTCSFNLRCSRRLC